MQIFNNDMVMTCNFELKQRDTKICDMFEIYKLIKCHLYVFWCNINSVVPYMSCYSVERDRLHSLGNVCFDTTLKYYLFTSHLNWYKHEQFVIITQQKMTRKHHDQNSIKNCNCGYNKATS